MQPFRKPTIKDVAAHAGVAVSTVSMFVSGREDLFSPETGERIRRAVAELHYVPSAHTRGLRARSTRTLGICASPPHMLHYYPQALHTTYLERLWNGFLMAADEVDYSLHYYPLSVREGTHYRPFLDGLVDGLVFNSDGCDSRPQKLAEAGMPLVLTERSLDVPEGCGCAYADERDTINLALTHLWERGHRRIAHLHGPIEPGITESEAFKVVPPEPYSSIAVRRRDAYLAWMQEHGVYSPTLLLPTRSWWVAGPDVGEALDVWLALPEPPTAIFCANDILAREVIAQLTQRQWSVPEQMSVVGVDNDSFCGEYQPPLTTVDIAAEQIGQEAVRALLRLMGGAPVEECRLELHVSRLVERGSVSGPRR